MTERYKSYWESREHINAWNGDETTDMDDLKSFLATINPGKTIEIGCGNGRFFPIYAELGLDVMATDLDAKRVSLCKFGKHRFKFKVLDIVETHIPDKFGLVVSSQVLLHIPPLYIRSAIKNMYQMTESGGYWWHCSYYNPRSLSTNNDDYKSPVYDGKGGNSFSHPLPELFAEAGMQIIDQHDITFKNGASNRVFVARKVL